MNRVVGSFTMALILGFALAPSPAVAQDNGLDSKLVKYVQDAKKSGQKQPQAQQKAIKAGWPPAAVSQAVAYVYGSSSAAPAANPAPGNALTAGGDKTQPSPTVVAQDTKKQQGRPAPRTGQTPALNTVNQAQAGSRGPAAAPRVPYEYQIGAGDTLQISVWREPEASASVQVRPDGMISMALTKEILVAGLTPTQVEKIITEKLVKVIQEPDVTVIVTGMNSKKIYAIGAVKKEGPIPYTYSMTILQAIAEAGGLTDYAKRKNIYVLRHENGKDTRFVFNYDEVLRGAHPEYNIVMLPGDTLMVPH
jgi:polysaccharide export outer membrane protein